MKCSRLIAWLFALNSLACISAQVPADEWRAGVASVVITPTEPTWLCGYGARTKPAEGKVHDLHAKALAIEGQDGTRLVLVTLDLGSVSEEITNAVHERVAKTHKLPRGSLILNVSHTHCAPEVAAERRVFHALPDDEEAKLARYIERLKEQLVELVDVAIRDLAPARLTVSKSSAAFGFNRRLPTPSGFVNSQNVDGVTDRDVPVLRVTAPDGKLRAILFGYACHNTTLAFQQYCGDYAGFAQQFVEAAHPEAKALFMMGCGGDQNPYPRHGERGLEFCKQHGRALADAVETALDSDQKEIHGPLRVAYEVAVLDLQPLPPREQLEADAKSAAGLPQRKARYLLEQLEKNGKIELKQTCPLHAARFGNDLLFIAISGETVVDYSLTSKKEFAGPFVWVAGYCDDVFAYLPSRRVLLEGGYEGRDGIIHQLVPTPFADSVEDRVMGGVRRLVKSVASSVAAGGPPGGRAADFDTWSTGRTIRFDYFHSGISREERVSLDEFRLEGDWPGSRGANGLVDELGLGEYIFEVADSRDGRVLFSRGFDSIFGEWQTTAEASAGTWRTFHESERFPEPRGAVRIVLKRRGSDGRLRAIYDAPFDPAGNSVNRAPLVPRGRIWPLFKNGEPADKLDLLILSEGYTAAEREKFHADAQRLSSVLFATEPFRSRKNAFNVWGLDLAADEPGITDPRRGLWRNSPLGFRSNAFGIDRYALSFKNRAIREAAALGPYDALAVIWNGPKHAGGGIYNLWAVAPADSPTAAYVFVHELGHSLAGLADEYYNSEVAYQQTDEITEPNSPNVTALLDPAKLKWRDLVDSTTPLPTPWNQARYDRIAAAHQTRVRALEARGGTPAELNQVYAEHKQTAGAALADEQHVDKTGAFEGAGYRGKGLYRPEVDCLMFSHARGAFCRVCSRAIEQVIRQHAE